MVSGQWRRYTGGVLRRWREEAGLSQTELGVELGFERQTIGRLESGAAEWTGYVAFMWATACGLNPYAVFPELIGPERQSDARDRVISFIQRGASDAVVEALDFYINGDHGSDLEAFLQKGVADLQSTMQGRVASTGLIETNSEYAEQTGQLSDPKGPRPNLDRVRRARAEGRIAAFSGQKYYRVKEGGEG